MLTKLAIKVGIAVVLTEVIILAVIGYYYTKQLSVEIDQRATDRVQILGVLLQQSLLKYSAISDRSMMTELIGDELVEGMVIATNGNIFHALDKSKIGKRLPFIEGINPNWFSTDKTSPQIIKVNNDIDNYLISITPIFALGSTQPFLFAYVKVDTTAVQTRKKTAKQQYIIGALLSVLLTSLTIFITFHLLILKRIKHAAHFAEEVQKGNLNTELEQPGNDELGMLEIGMNAMVQNLKKRGLQRDIAADSLRIANETLERRVRERTEEASEMVDRLKREITNHTETGKALRRQSSYIRLLQRITVAANESTSAEGALQICLDTLCKHFLWPIGHVYNLSEKDSSLLVSAKIWQFDKPENYISFKNEAEKTQILLGTGLPGKVLRSGTPIWLTDAYQEDYTLPLKAIDQGYATSFAFPIILGREVVAIFEFFMDSREKPKADFFEVIRDVGVQLGRIIERKRAEDELQKAMTNADIANKAKSEFLSNFSHELRTPMNAIVGYSQILSTDDKNPLNEIHAEQVSVILNAGTHLVALMDQVLDLARIESGEYPIIITTEKIITILNETIALAEPLAKSIDVKLSIEKSDALSSSVQVDRLALKQIILNLLSNAIKYGGSNNQVNIVASRPDSETTRISVIDHGPGISSRKLKNIFLPFRKLNSFTDTANVSGTGIGLSLSVQLAEMMGCTMDVESIEGRGCTFWVDIPSD